MLLIGIAAAACSQNRSHQALHSVVPSLVAVSVPDLDAAVAWYTAMLGFSLEKQSSFPDYHLRLAILSRDSFQLELVELQGSKTPSELIPGLDNPALLQGFGKLGFRVADAAQWAAELEKRGAKFQVPLRDDPDAHTRSFIVLDNNGNWLEFSQEIP